MSTGEVIGHTTVRCSRCEHPNDGHAEWCELCLAEVEPARRRRIRPRRLSTRALARPSGGPVAPQKAPQAAG